MATVKVYEGGLASFDGPTTWPATADQGQMYKPDPTSGEVDTNVGDPANGSGKSADGGFVMNAGQSYSGSADMEPGGMKVIDLDDIKGTEIVNKGNISTQTDGY